MLENRMIIEEGYYEFNTDKYDERMNALAEKEDEEWEDYEGN